MWQVFGSAAAALGSSALKGLGSYLGSKNASDNSAANAALQVAYQREFAQNGIRWRVADAKAAGIHPLAALGAQTFSYSPVSVQGEPDGLASALSSMGQGIDRAVQAKQLAEERALDRQLKEAQIANVNAQTKAANAQADAISAQAAASQNAVARTALPPPMPMVNGDEPQADRNGFFVDKSIIRDGFLLDENGKKIAIIPSDPMKARTEDVLGVEWFPFISSAWRDFKGRVLKQKVNGHYWHGDFDNGEYLPYPRSEYRGKLNLKNPPKVKRWITVSFPNLNK